MGLGGILAEMQITAGATSNGMLVLMHAVVAMNVTVGAAVMMSVIVVVVMVPIMVMMMIAMMVMGMQVLVAIPTALAINTNVLRPAAAYLAHGYLPLLVVEGLLAEGSPA
ncbi:hypothetical protein GCM10010837_10300 [Aminobacter niigataensis]